MDTGSRLIDVDPNKNLTKRQCELLRLIEARKCNGMPMVQRDLAESLGIRRESVNKLLRRLRMRLDQRGHSLEMPQRCGQTAVTVGTLMDGALV